MNPKQYAALYALCERYGVRLNVDDFAPTFDLPTGYVAGWIKPTSGNWIYVGCSPDGDISS